MDLQPNEDNFKLLASNYNSNNILIEENSLERDKINKVLGDK